MDHSKSIPLGEINNGIEYDDECLPLILVTTAIYANLIQKIGSENVSLLSVMTNTSKQPTPNDATKIMAGKDNCRKQNS